MRFWENQKREDVRQLLSGMRNVFPQQVPAWLAKLEHATDFIDLGSDIADSLAVDIQQYVQAQVQAVRQASVQPNHNLESAAEIKDLKEKLELAESFRKRAEAHVRESDSKAWQAQLKSENAQKATAQQIERLKQEIADLQRIVGEQQFRLNQQSKKTE